MTETGFRSDPDACGAFWNESNKAVLSFCRGDTMSTGVNLTTIILCLLCAKAKQDNVNVIFCMLSQVSSDQTLFKFFEEITNMAVRLNLSKTVAENAKHLFQDIYYGKFLNGHVSETSASASVYIAVKCV